MDESHGEAFLESSQHGALELSSLYNSTHNRTYCLLACFVCLKEHDGRVTEVCELSHQVMIWKYIVLWKLAGQSFINMHDD